MADSIQIHDLEFEPFISRREIQNRVKEIGNALEEKYRDEVPVFMGMLSGAFIFIADIIRAFKADCEVSFVKYHSYHGTESTGTLNEVLGVDDNIKGRVVILIEDIIDSGNTMKNIMPLIQAKEPKHLEVVSLLFKPSAVVHPVHIDHIGFEIEDKFVVGYGLDYNGVGRNLKAIYQVKEK